MEDGGGILEGEGSCHLVYYFLQSLSKGQLADLQNEMGVRRVSLEEFIALLMRVAPNLKMKCNTKNLPATDLQQVALIRELFEQVDEDRDGVIAWSDISTLLFDIATADRKHRVSAFTDIPILPVFKNEPAATLAEPGESRGGPAAPPAFPLGRKVHGEGLYWREVERLKYFPGIKLFALVGGSHVFLVNIPGPRGHIAARLPGPTAAVFDIYHFPAFDRILGCCADRYIYTWLDSNERWTLMESVKVHTPQLCATYDRTLLFTGGTDGAVLIYKTIPKLQYPMLKVECSQGWITDILTIPDLEQIAMCDSLGKISLWEITLDSAHHEATGLRNRSQVSGHGMGVRTRVVYSQRYRLLTSIGFSHHLVCWNPFISSQTTTLQGHDKVLTHVHAFSTSPEVISADVSGRIIIWDIRSMAAVQTLGGPDSRHPLQSLTMFAFNSDLNHIVTVGSTLALFPAAGPAVSETVTIEAPTSHILFHHGQHLIITISGCAIHTWHTSGELRSSLTKVSRSEITAALLTVKDVIIGNVEGEVRFVSILNGTWLQQLLCGDTIVSMAFLSSHTPNTHARLVAKRGRVTEKDGSDPKLLVTVTQAGQITVWYHGKIGEETEVLAWRSLMDAVTLTASTCSGHFLVATSKECGECWHVPSQSLKRTFRHASEVTACTFAEPLQAMLLTERIGVLHVYSFSSFTYLMRMTLASGFIPTSIQYLRDECLLLVTGKSAIKVVSLRDILDQFHMYEDFCHLAFGECETSLFKDRYLCQRVAKGKYLKAFDQKRNESVGVRLYEKSDDAWRREATLLKLLAKTNQVATLLDLFEDGGRIGLVREGLGVTLLESHEMSCWRTRWNSEGRPEVQWITMCLARGLAALADLEVVVFLNPSKVAKIRGVWKIVDVDGATALKGSTKVGIPTSFDLSTLEWRHCPPEHAQAKRDCERALSVPRQSIAVGKPSYPNLASPTGEEDLWGLGLVVWFVARKQQLWAALSEDEVRRVLVEAANLTPKQKDMPRDLQLNPVMRPVLEGLLTRRGRWGVTRILEHFEFHGCNAAPRVDDVIPFPLTAKSCPVGFCESRSIGVLSISNSVLSASSSVLDISELSSFVSITYSGRFTASYAVPPYIFAAEWDSWALSCLGLHNKAHHGSLPLPDAAKELRLPVPPNPWQPPDMVKVEHKGDLDRILHAAKQVEVEARASPRSTDQPSPQHRPLDLLTPFYKTFKKHGSPVPEVFPFYLATKKTGKPMAITSLDKLYPAKPSSRASSRRQPDSRPVAQDQKRLGMDFICSTLSKAPVGGDECMQMLSSTSREISAVKLAREMVSPQAKDSVLFRSIPTAFHKAQLAQADQRLADAGQRSTTPTSETFSRRSRTPLRTRLAALEHRDDVRQERSTTANLRQGTRGRVTLRDLLKAAKGSDDGSGGPSAER